MKSEAVTIDLGFFVETALATRREAWLSYYRHQRALMSSFPGADAAAMRGKNGWSDHTFRRALDWAALNPADLGATVWSATQSFFRRIGNLCGANLYVVAEQNGTNYLIGLTGNAESVRGAKEAILAGAGQFKLFGPQGGYLYWWSMAIDANAEIELLGSRGQTANDYLIVRTAALIEYGTEIATNTNSYIRRLRPAIAEQFGVADSAAQSLLDADALAVDRLEQSTSQTLYREYSTAKKLDQDIKADLTALLSRAKLNGFELSLTYQRALLELPEYSAILNHAAHEPDGKYDTKFASLAGLGDAA